MLNAFFCYYGGKWRAAPRYPSPRHPLIIEPFAGAAGYATRYADRAVWLYDVDPIIVGTWQYLIRVSPTEILALPDVDESGIPPHLPQEARWLIGFWLNKGSASPCKTPSRWMRDGIRPNSFWGEAVRQRIAQQVTSIRHWRVTQGGYDSIPDVCATWFVDPPYVAAPGRRYRFSSIDYAHLGAWCASRPGQTLVCENSGATWLPFAPFHTIKGTVTKYGQKQSVEVLWENNTLLEYAEAT